MIGGTEFKQRRDSTHVSSGAGNCGRDSGGFACAPRD